LEECKGSLVNFFIRILIEETGEFDIRDKERHQQFVQAYIDKANVISGKKEEILFKHRGKIAKGYVEKHKDTVFETELTHHIIGGYEKTAFSKNFFESKQEKRLADILDPDKEVQRWGRPPAGQMSITYKGANYNPDFVVEVLKDKFFVVEVKAKDEITDEDVQAKAGVAWCRAMSKATGKVWKYKLIPHDVIKSTLSF